MLRSAQFVTICFGDILKIIDIVDFKKEGQRLRSIALSIFNIPLQ